MLGLEIAGLEGRVLYLVRAPFIERCHLPILVVAGAQGWGRWGRGVVQSSGRNWSMYKVRYTCPQEHRSAYYGVRARADE